MTRKLFSTNLGSGKNEAMLDVVRTDDTRPEKNCHYVEKLETYEATLISNNYLQSLRNPIVKFGFSPLQTIDISLSFHD